MVTIMERRLKPILEKAEDGRPDYWYGVVDPFSGSLWSVLYPFHADAKKCADEIGGGTVVLVSARILVDSEGEYIVPEN